MTILYCMTLSLIMVMNMSPQKMSLILTTLSIVSAMMIYNQTNSMFLSSATIISFSSGMMILFSYCSMMSLYEEKSKLYPKMIFSIPVVISTILFSSPVMKNSTLEKMSSEISSSIYLVLTMSIVIVTMISINKTFYEKTKKLMTSYLCEK